MDIDSVGPRNAVNQHGDRVEVDTFVQDGMLFLTFCSENGKTGSCIMESDQAWLYARDIIDGAMHLDPEFIRELVQMSIEKFQATGRV